MNRLTKVFIWPVIHPIVQSAVPLQIWLLIDFRFTGNRFWNRKLVSKCTMQICGGKCYHSSIENDYCGGKPGLSPLPLIITLTLTLNPNPKDVTKPNPNPADPTNPNQLTTNPSISPQKSFSMLLWRYLPPQKIYSFKIQKPVVIFSESQPYFWQPLLHAVTHSASDRVHALQQPVVVHHWREGGRKGGGVIRQPQLYHWAALTKTRSTDCTVCIVIHCYIHLPHYDIIVPSGLCSMSL